MQAVKLCRHCGKEFAPARPLQAVCSPRCSFAEVRVAKRAEKAAERDSLKARREKLKTIADRIAEAQIEFNAYIRLRDKMAGFACISSGAALDWSGNAVDAGHYRSTGAASHLRFNSDNCHCQTKQENRYLAGNAADYRLGLIRRIGLARVEALESDNEPHKWSHAELIEIKAKYRAKRKTLDGNQ